mmetsp:Transcript_14420/g.36023  ORF Transcript_14420/g.36023 Transcript_14420/m.36023 type:complete len:255 (-) Transcript_14420:1481-2245(-)
MITSGTPALVYSCTLTAFAGSTSRSPDTGTPVTSPKWNRCISIWSSNFSSGERHRTRNTLFASGKSCKRSIMNFCNFFGSLVCMAFTSSSTRLLKVAAVPCRFIRFSFFIFSGSMFDFDLRKDMVLPWPPPICAFASWTAPSLVASAPLRGAECVPSRKSIAECSPSTSATPPAGPVSSIVFSGAPAPAPPPAPPKMKPFLILPEEEPPAFSCVFPARSMSSKSSSDRSPPMQSSGLNFGLRVPSWFSTNIWLA